MQAEERNYEVAGDPSGEPGAAVGPAGLSVREERAWSIVAHLSIFLNLLTGLLGPVAALAIWLVFRGRSREVAFHALQSMWYQVAWLVLLGIGWAFTGLLTLVLIGFLLIPVMALVSVAPFVHAAYAAYRVSGGDRYRYALVADLIEDR